MHISSLSLRYFRNIDHLHLQTDKQPVVFIGDNGAGKTNILESLSLFSPGRGLRSADPKDLAKQGQQIWSAAIKLEDEYGEHTLASGISLENGRRIYKANGEPLKTQTELLDYVRVVWLTPQMNRLFIDSATNRRKFFDRLVFALFPSHAKAVARYEKAQSERSFLIKTQQFHNKWIEGLENILVECAQDILLLRKLMLGYLNENQESSLPLFSLQLFGKCEECEQEQGIDYALSTFRDSLASSRKETILNYGPHRTDLKATLNHEIPASMASTGQQQMLLLGILFSFCKVMSLQAPDRMLVLLLDDVVAHFDFHHRVLLFEKLCKGQKNLHAWLSGAESSYFDPIKEKAQLIFIENGKVASHD